MGRKKNPLQVKTNPFPFSILYVIHYILYSCKTSCTRIDWSVAPHPVAAGCRREWNRFSWMHRLRHLAVTQENCRLRTTSSSAIIILNLSAFKLLGAQRRVAETPGFVRHETPWMRVKTPASVWEWTTKGFLGVSEEWGERFDPEEGKKKKSLLRETLWDSNPQAEPAVAEMCDHHCTAIKGRLRVAHLKTPVFHDQNRASLQHARRVWRH